MTIPWRRALLLVRAAAVVTTIVRLVGRRPVGPPAGPARPASSTEPSRAGVVPIVSVVVPARDEEHRIGPCLAALRDVRAVGEVVVVDDGSTDRTAAIAAAAGARVVAGLPVPAGWVGKAWALQQGIEAATGAFVVTLDADARPGPGLIDALSARLAEGADLVTVAGAFECPTRGAALLHPALLTTLVYRFGRPGRALGPERLLANGQCMAVPREAFLAGGGMAPVGDRLVEDVALARRIARLGGRVEFVDGPELLTVRMFETAADTWRGWGRSIALPGVEPLVRQLVDASVLALVLALPPVRMALRRGDAVDAVALAVRLGTLAGTRRAYRRAGWSYWLSPLADPVAVVRLVVSIVRPSRTWRGRIYPTPA